MVTVKLQKLIESKERNLSWVARKTEITYSTLHKLNSNNTTSISFKTIDKLCSLFQCDISDLIEYKED